jgi:nitrogen permease regulator 3-like protein
MAAPANMKDASNGLVAVLLLTRSRSGPKLVYHYPAIPEWQTNKLGKPDVDPDLESDDEDAEAPKTGVTASGPNNAAKNAMTLAVDDGPEFADDKLLGYNIDSLEKLLSPGRWADGKMFEICLDGLTFVGHPAFAGEGGSWVKDGEVDVPPPPPPPKVPGSQDDPEYDEAAKDEAGISTANNLRTANITITAPETPAKPRGHDFTHIPDSLDSQLGTSLATSFNSGSTTSGAVADPMTMFHVILALSSDRQHIASDMYLHIARTLGKALHYCEKQSGYVTTETMKVLALKAKAKQLRMRTQALWTQLVESSELAWALKEVYEKIAAGGIAGIRLNGNEISLHLPLQEGKQGLDDSDLTPFSGLLLLEDKDALLRELSHPDASPLAYFIREHTHTKNLRKHSINLNMPTNDILYLARHLIKWRKAKGLPPLHPRNTYVVAPQAPIERVAGLSTAYSRRFPALPSLEAMLKILSGRPMRYGTLIPSKDHRAPFMDILAFLLKHELVAQLKTFGWLQVSSKHEAVTKDRETRSSKKRPVSGAGVSLLSPQGRIPDGSHAAENDSISVSSELSAATAITAVNNGSRAGAPTSSSISTPQPQIITDPMNPSEEVARVLKRIRASFEDPELRERFPALLRYFDGEHAFEEIAAKEGVKRARVEEWLGVLDGRRLLVTFRSL